MSREMKNSGIPWIGEIPKGWKVLRVKDVVKQMKSGGTPDSSNNEFYNDCGTPWVAIGDMQHGGCIYDTKKHLSEDGIKDKSLIIFPSGTLLYSIYASIGKVSILQVPATINQAILALSFTKNYSSNFAKYVLMGIEDYVFSFANGNTQFNLNSFIVSNLPIPFTTEYEQQKIAFFLDRKCAEIDEMIALQEKIVEELKAYKQAVITEAVTKGLNLDAPMKDSGIEWIGVIPEHWIIKRGKHTLNLLKRPVRDSDEVVTCFRDGDVILRSLRRTEGFTMSDKEIGYQGINEGDIVIHGMDGFAGAMGVSKSTGKGSPVLVVCESKYDAYPQYVIYYLRTLAFRDVFVSLSTGIRERSCDLRWNKIAELPFILPSMIEQMQISEYLDTKCTEIDSIITIKLSKIDSLKEYKKSIIYEYVTGKKEVTQ